MQLPTFPALSPQCPTKFLPVCCPLMSAQEGNIKCVLKFASEVKVFLWLHGVLLLTKSSYNKKLVCKQIAYTLVLSLGHTCQFIHPTLGKKHKHVIENHPQYKSETIY